MSKTESRQKKRLWYRLGVAGLIITLVSAAFWFGTSYLIKANIKAELERLDFGKPIIGSISIGSGGIVAHEVEFHHAGGDSEPWLKFDELRIKHPILELVTGASSYNEIELNAAQAVLDLKEAEDENVAFQFNLDEIKLPARKVDINRSELILRHPDHPLLYIKDINLSIEHDEVSSPTQITLDGSIGSFLGGQFDVQGVVSPSENDYEINLASEAIQLENGKWQKWPYLPKNLEQYVEADGELSVQFVLESDSEKQLTFAAESEIRQLAVRFPDLDIDLSVSSGKVNFEDEGELVFSNIQATTDQRDRVNVYGTARVAEFPITSQFQGQFQNVDMATWRKLAPVIPQIVSGISSGPLKGNVTVDSDLRSIVNVSTEARGDDFAYGSIVMNAVIANVHVKNLTFDSGQQFETVQGRVDLEGVAPSQSVDHVFQTFELQDMNRQLEIAGDGSATITLGIPLDAADDLSSWSMLVDAEVERGLISQQKLNDVKLTAEFEEGALVIRSVHSVPLVENADESTLGPPNLEFEFAWPMGEPSQLAPLTVKGQRVSPRWLSKFFERQIQLATGNAKQFPTIDQLDGQITFEANLQIPVEQPENLELWKADSLIAESTVMDSTNTLSELTGELILSQGELSFDQIRGKFQHGGSLEANGRINLTQSSDITLHVSSRETPAAWVADLTDEIAPQIFDYLKKTSDEDPGNRTIDGYLAIELDLLMAGDLQQKGRNEEDSWHLKTKVTSNALVLGDNRLTDVVLDGVVSESQVSIQQLTANWEERGRIDGAGQWESDSNSGNGELSWNQIPIDMLAAVGKLNSVDVRGETDGQIRFSILPDPAEGEIPLMLEGTIATRDFAFETFKTVPFQFDVVTRDGNIYLEQWQFNEQPLELELEAQARLSPPFQFQVQGDLGSQQLSKLFQQPSVTEEEGITTAVTGVVSGNFEVTGQLEEFDWQTQGEIRVDSAMLDQTKLGDFQANWKHLGNDWKKSTLNVKAFGGTIEMVELVSAPERVRVEINDIDAFSLTKVLNLPAEFTGKLSGDASLNEWSVFETRWADLNLKGSSVLIGAAELGDFTAAAEYRKSKLSYEINGSLMGGRLVGSGESLIGDKTTKDTRFPFEVVLTNGSLDRLSSESNYFRAVRQLEGDLSARVAFEFGFSAPPEGLGRVAVRGLKWKNELLTRDASIRFVLNEGTVFVDDVQADLNRGSINASATIPLDGNTTGSYEIDVRQMDLARIVEIMSGDSGDTQGLFDARLNGRIGKRFITGNGIVGVSQAKLHGVTGQSMRIPIQYSLEPLRQSGRIELRRTTFRLFNGNVSGKATFDVGQRFDLDVDLKLSNVDTGKMLAAVAGIDDSNQGRMSGRLTVNGRGIRSSRDLNGSFVGSLERSAAFQLPVIESLARFLAGGNLQSRDYDSDRVDLRLNQGRVDVRNLNFHNSLVKIAITGDAFLDGRLDLRVAARVDRIDQPTLLDQLAGSPLVRFSGSQAALFAQAARFVSERVVFLSVNGTFERPQVRIDAGQQLREETIQYFLRGSQILPNRTIPNN